MFGIGFLEICLIAVVALVFVGPQQLPELMRQIGKFVLQARRMSSEVRNSIEQAVHDVEQEIDKEKSQLISGLSEDKQVGRPSQSNEENPPLSIELETSPNSISQHSKNWDSTKISPDQEPRPPQNS